jgi:putative Mg2+ transporter-C (MgtC) family protein
MDLQWANLLTQLVKLAVAFGLALPIGWERRRSGRTVGMRTFPLVAVASCGYVLVAQQVLGMNGAEHSRVLQGLMTGIGFVGGGAILKSAVFVRGTATAASIWNTGAIGAAAGYGVYPIAVLLSLINFLALRLLTPFDQPPDSEPGASGGSGRGEGDPSRL